MSERFNAAVLIIRGPNNTSRAQFVDDLGEENENWFFETSPGEVIEKEWTLRLSSLSLHAQELIQGQLAMEKLQRVKEKLGTRRIYEEIALMHYRTRSREPQLA